MAENTDPHVDPVTGVRTTGHEWDGVRELNQPLPRWWLWIFYATIVWGVAYWIAYPSWPLISSHVSGVLGWSSRGDVARDLQDLRDLRGPMVARLAETDVTAVQDDAELFDFTLAYGKAAFGDNCAPCHGSGGGGAVGYPNLIDDDWLWGGSIEDIQHTIAYGVRSDHDDARIGDMPAFGRDEILSGQEIANVAAYIRSTAGLEAQVSANLEEGAVTYEENCAACHGEDGSGNRELGAPRLSDAIWLYGSDHATIVQTVRNGRQSAMPAWGARLGETTVKALAVYVHTLGGGE